MDIGDPKRTITIEPIENPVPQRVPVKTPDTEPERELVPAGPDRKPDEREAE
jgi:hypothetical protein